MPLTNVAYQEAAMATDKVIVLPRSAQPKVTPLVVSSATPSDVSRSDTLPCSIQCPVLQPSLLGRKYPRKPSKTTQKQPFNMPPQRVDCTEEVRGKRVKSITVCAEHGFNIVDIQFLDGTAFSVELFPSVRLKAEINDWNVGEGRLLKKWPDIATDSGADEGGN